MGKKPKRTKTKNKNENESFLFFSLYFPVTSHCWFWLGFWALRTSCHWWLINMCVMTHSYVWHESFTCVTWLIHICDTTHSYAWHDSFIRLTWFIHIYDMTHSHVWHASFICNTSQSYLTWLNHMWNDWHLCDMPHETFEKRTSTRHYSY